MRRSQINAAGMNVASQEVTSHSRRRYELIRAQNGDVGVICMCVSRMSGASKGRTSKAS